MSRFYTLSLLTALGMGLFLSGLSVYLVNPYSVLPGFERSGFNYFKPGLDRRAEIYKAKLIKEVKPKILLIGNSRTEVALNAQHPAFSDRPTVNAALTGANLAEIISFYRQAVDQGSLETVILGLDPISFTVTSLRQGIQDAGIGQGHSPVHQAWNLFKIHLSMEALSDTWQTLNKQSAMKFNRFLADERGSRNPQFMAGLLQSSGGSGKESARILQEMSFEESWSDWQQYLRHNSELLTQASLDACQRGIAVKWVVLPLHVELVERWMQALGQEKLFSWFKTLQSVRQTVQAHCTGPQPELWTAFSYGPLNAEPIPPAADKAAVMPHYWEVSHPKRTLGDEVLNRIHGLPGSDSSGLQILKLEEGNLEDYLKQLSLGRTVYHSTLN